MSIENHLLALREDPKNFAKFYRATKRFWFSTAHRIMKRHYAPGVSADDIVQEMLTTIIEKDLVGSWEGPERHGSITHYVIKWGAITAVHKYLSQARGRSSATGASREPLPVSWLGLAGPSAANPESVDIIAMTAGVSLVIDGWIDSKKVGKNKRERVLIESLRTTASMDKTAEDLGVSRKYVMQQTRRMARRVSNAA